MSDALTDIARDQQRQREFTTFVGTVIEYIILPDAIDNVKAAAETCDAVPQGYWSGKTALAKGIEDWLTKLKNGNEEVWIKWLLKIKDRCHEFDGYEKYKMSYFEKAKSLSPYKNKTILKMNYGIGFGHVEGEIKTVLDKIIAEKGFALYDADKYAVILDQPITGKVVWLGNGCGSPDPDEYSTPMAEERKKIRIKRAQNREE